MLMLIGIGLCIYAYCIYKNQDYVLLNLAKMGVKIEDMYLNYKGTRISYLVPDHENKMLIDKCNKFYLQKYVDNISKTQSYNENNNNYFVVLNFSIKRKTLCYVKNSLIFNDREITEDDVNYSSPIILCSVNVNQRINGDVKNLFTNYDVTKIINNLVNRNTKIILSNLPKYKEFWIYYLNYFLQDRNIYINVDDLNEIEFEWNIMKDDLEKIEGSEILISTNESKTNISNISSNEIEKIVSESEYDSFDDINLSKIKNRSRNQNLINEILGEKSNNEQEPSLDEQDPSLDEHDPSLDEHDPSLDEQDPSFDEQDPSLDEHDPSLDEQEPLLDEQEPLLDEQEPLLDEQDPSLDEQESSLDEQEPSLDKQVHQENENNSEEEIVNENNDTIQMDDIHLDD